jgi:hypothetical protein
MKPNSCLLLAISTAVMTSAGCFVETSTTITTVDTHILDTQIRGPITNIPVHMTTAHTPHTVTLTPFGSANTRNVFAGDVSNTPRLFLSSFYPIDTIVGVSGTKTLVRRIPDHSLHWTTPSALVGADMDIAGDMTSFCAGVTFCRVGGSTTMGFHANVGLFGKRENFGARFEAGVDYNGCSSRTASAAVTLLPQRIFSVTFPRGLLTPHIFWTKLLSGVLDVLSL